MSEDMGEVADVDFDDAESESNSDTGGRYVECIWREFGGVQAKDSRVEERD